MLNQNLLLGDDGYLIQRSLRFRSSASAYLNRTPASAGNQQKFTWSGWLKRGQLGTLMQLFSVGTTSPNTNFAFYFNGSGGGASAVDALEVYSQSAGTANGYYTSQQVLRDPSAWYHIVLSVDTTQATSGNRLLIWVNNQLVTLTGSTVFAQNTNTVVNSTTSHRIATSVSTTQFFDGYLAEINFIDGQALTPSSFGQTDPVTGVWQPKKYTGTYGTNGFYLPFTDNSALTSGSNAGLGKDFSGNGNYWNTNNISITSGSTYDSMTDVPTLTSASASNFAIFSPIDYSGAVLSNANLTVTYNPASWGSSRGTFGVSSGKYYWEIAVASFTYVQIGIFATNSTLIGDTAASASGYIYNALNGQKYNNSVGTAYGATYGVNDVIGVALDMDNGTLTFYKNGTSQGTAFTGLTGSFSPVIGLYTSSVHANFGQRPFSYTPPSGFKALNTFNLPDATIKKGNKYMDVSLWTGNSSTQTITNSGSMQPDFVWIKSRSNGTLAHQLFDAVRGTNKALYSNLTNAEFTDTDGLTSFNSNGWTMGAEGGINGSPETFVGWQWNAGGSTVTNTSGSISSQVRANPTAGFSIVTYTGTGANATVGHGLGVAPSMVIVKCRTNGVYNWSVYHRSTGATGLMILQTTNAFVSSSTTWNNTAPTSSVLSIGTDNGTNASSQNFVAYCFSDVQGFSKAFSYTGNGSADGPFTYLGFRPRYVMIKRSDVGGDNWLVLDTARDTYNAAGLELYPSASAAESANNSRLDILSNGFKIRVGSTASNYNASGGTYIGIAFAENPFKNSLAR